MRISALGRWLLAVWILTLLCGAVVCAHAAATCDDFVLTRAGMAYLTACALTGGEAAVPIGPAVPSFSDVPASDWAYTYIEYAAAQSVVQGYPDGTFLPRAQLTRATMATFAARALAGSDAAVPTGPATPTFSDVPVDHWAYRYIEYLVAHGLTIASTTSPLTFAPQSPMSAFAAASWLQQATGVALDPCRIPALSHISAECVSMAIGGAYANGASVGPALSDDGRYVAFVSDATNLVPGDTNQCRDAFVYDRQTWQLSRVSVSSSGEQADWGSDEVAISADGRYVAFSSLATNLVPGDTNFSTESSGGVTVYHGYDVFVRDRVAGTTERVSVAGDGTQGNGDSTRPSISADGRYVVFASSASNLAAGDTNGVSDIFLYDRVTHETQRVSLAADGAQANGASPSAVISADGRVVAFLSEATNLVPDDTNGVADVFVRDLAAGTTERVSIAGDGTQANGACTPDLSINGDGRVVAFVSTATNLDVRDTDTAEDIYVRDRAAGATTLESVSCTVEGWKGSLLSVHPSLSADGRILAFDSPSGNLTPKTAALPYSAWWVFLRDLVSGCTNLGSEGSPDVVTSVGGVMSADGHLVAFSSEEMVDGFGTPNNGMMDVFVRDPEWHNFGTITGGVTDAITHAAIPGAVVWLDGVRWADASSGSYIYPWVLALGAHAVTASAPGYIPASLTKLIVTAGLTVTADLVLVPAVAPEADFSAAPTSGPIPLTVAFTDLSTSVPTAWAWDFGDGGASAARNPSHQYTAAGSYTVRLTVTSPSGSDTKTKAAYITALAPPAADFSATPLSGIVPLTVAFTDASANGPTAWAWDFGDGGTSTVQNPSHQYTAAGSYTVSLTATNATGSGTKTKAAYITALTPPVADFSAAPVSGVVPLTVAFADASANDPTAWAWDFGDGGASATRNPNHTYAKPGIYTVGLTATNAGGSNTKTKADLITVLFTDVPADFYAFAQIMACVKAGIVAGYPDGSYQPTAQVTRDQMAVYISRALAGGDAKVPTPPATASFPDVKTDYWAYKYVEYAKSKSIVNGYPDGTYQPTNPVDRGQMAIYIARSIVDPAGDAGLAAYTPPAIPSFPDVQTDYYAYKYIEYIKSKRVTGGYPDGTYQPAAVVTRDQMAVYVARAFKLM